MLHAHQRETVGQQPTSRDNTTCHSHVVQHNEIHEAVEQATRAMTRPNPCTKQKGLGSCIVPTLTRCKLIRERPLVTPTTRGNTTCQPQVVCRGNKQAVLEQVDIETSSTDTCTMHGSMATRPTTEHSRSASTSKIGHWSTTDNQEKQNMSATCGAPWQQTRGRGASN